MAGYRSKKLMAESRVPIPDNDYHYQEYEDLSDYELFKAKADHYEQIRNDLELMAVWSIYEAEDLNDKHPYHGADMIVYKDHWGKDPAGAKIKGDRWIDLYVAADAAIRDSGDHRHIFVYRFTSVNDDNNVLILTTGS